MVNRFPQRLEVIPIYSGKSRSIESNLGTLLSQLAQLRDGLELVFAPDTAFPGTGCANSSTGHCAVVAKLIRDRFGGDYLSAIVGGESHWFNRLRYGEIAIDVDLTGDQFGRARVQIAKVNRLYPGTRVRRAREMNKETRARAHRLQKRLNLVQRGVKGAPFMSWLIKALAGSI